MKTFALLAAALVQTVPPQEPSSEGKVVVTARRLDATETALKACIARGCPADEEIAAALAHAENQFVEGDYKPARRTLLDTIGRVDRQAKTYPVAVADIWRAEARIAAHLGERDPMRIGQFESLDALRAGLDRADARVLIQRIEVADTLARQNRIINAREAYRDISRDAAKAGHPRVRGIALMRIAMIDGALAQADPALFGARSRASLAAVLTTTEPELQPYRDAARLLKARLSVKSGDPATIDRVVADYAVLPVDRPVLIYEPARIDALIADQFVDGTSVARGSAINFDGQWADITFLIDSAGKVRDLEVMRASPTLSGAWLKPVMAAIAARRYAPLNVPEGLDGVRRVERFTLTAFLEQQTGSRVRARTQPRIETLDLTAEAPPRGGGGGASPASVPADEIAELPQRAALAAVLAPARSRRGQHPPRQTREG